MISIFFCRANERIELIINTFTEATDSVVRRAELAKYIVNVAEYHDQTR